MPSIRRAISRASVGVLWPTSRLRLYAARDAAKELGLRAGRLIERSAGRGKGGGVKLAKNADEAREIARRNAGHRQLVTHQRAGGQESAGCS